MIIMIVDLGLDFKAYLRYNLAERRKHYTQEMKLIKLSVRIPMARENKTAGVRMEN